MTNKQIIDILNEISELLELKNENRFKIRAYQKLSQYLAGFGSELSGIYREKGREGLLEVEHVGEGIGKKIIELLETGRLKYLDELKESLPEGIETFLKIPGMGPKTAVIIGEKFRVKTVADLEKLIKAKKLRDLKGFKEKTEEKLLKGIEMYKQGLERRMLGEAYPVSRKIISDIKAAGGVKKIAAAGSLRRMEETVGDIDILAVSGEPEKIMEAFCSMDMVKEVTAKGEKKASVITVYGIQADLRVVPEESYGAAMQYFTGNKAHNVLARELAVKKGLKLNEYGLYEVKGDKLIAGEDEEDIYKELGLQYIPPELRTGGDEIGFALKNKIPALVELNGIKGDFHCHTLHSDGNDTVEHMAKAARDRGYLFLGITNHSQSLQVARGLKPQAVKDLAMEIDSINKKFKGAFTILKGSEVDILPDGSLDYPDEILSKLDVVIGSVHSNFKMNREEMTQRLLKAMDNKYLNIIGHISGRLIHNREPYEVDYESIFKKAAKTGTAIEINSQPERLDLKDIYVRQAVSMGVKLAIDTDAHAADQLDYMFYGVGVARRGWAAADDIINTWSLKKVMEWLKRKRG